MDKEVLKNLREHFTQYPSRKYPKGQIVLFAHETPQNLYFVAQGKIKQYELSYRGDEIVVHRFQNSFCFPTSWAFNHRPSPYFYKTETGTTLHMVPVVDYMLFLRANPDVMMDYLSRINTHVEEVYGRMVHSMAGTAKSRLVYELLMESKHAIITEHGHNLILRVHEVDLASRSGLSRETVSREIRGLKNSGCLDIIDRTIIVKDIGELERSLHLLMPPVSNLTYST